MDIKEVGRFTSVVLKILRKAVTVTYEEIRTVGDVWTNDHNRVYEGSPDKDERVTGTWSRTSPLGLL